MKYITQVLMAAFAGLLFSSCNKVQDLPHYSNGVATTLTSSIEMISTTPADSAKSVVSFNWTDPKYAQDSSLYKYVLEIDSAGRNFSSEYKLTLKGSRSASLTGKQFNDIVAGLGLSLGATSSLDVRVTSSYNNNNEAYVSNVISLKAMPYVVPVTISASSSAPLTLAIANASSQAVGFNWTATQYGAKTFTYTLQLDTAGGNFATPQQFNVGGSLTKTFTVQELNSAIILAGITGGSAASIEFRVAAFLPNSTTPAVLSNVSTINVTSYVPFLYLWVPGDYQGWNPGAAPQLGATSPDLTNFEGYVYVPTGHSNEFKLTDANDWNHTAYGGAVGVLSTSGGNLLWPNGPGYYYVKANPTALTWFAKPATWAIIGDATPGGWGSDTQMIYDAANNVWVINSVALTAANVKFRANANWNDPGFPNNNSNLGGDLNNLGYGGDNISVAVAGNYKITLDLSHPLKYNATFTKL